MKKFIPSIILFIGYFYFGIFRDYPFFGFMLGMFGVWAFAMANILKK